MESESVKIEEPNYFDYSEPELSYKVSSPKSKEIDKSKSR